MSAREHLIVFVKAPRVGLVKTRLAQTVGAEKACQAYTEIVELLLNQLSGLENIELRFTPDEGGLEIAHWIRRGWHGMPQGPGDLGARLLRAFEEAFSRGAERVAIIGSDCPGLTMTDIQQAWHSLEDHDVVFGPAADGGYWLVAMKTAHAALFRDIPWSCDNTLAASLQKAKDAGLQVGMLRELFDIDDEPSWQRFRATHKVDPR